MVNARCVRVRFWPPNRNIHQTVGTHGDRGAAETRLPLDTSGTSGAFGTSGASGTSGTLAIIANLSNFGCCGKRSDNFVIFANGIFSVCAYFATGRRARSAQVSHGSRDSRSTPFSLYIYYILKSEKNIYNKRGIGIEQPIGKVKLIFDRISLHRITHKTKAYKMSFAALWHASSTIEVAHKEKIPLAIPPSRFCSFTSRANRGTTELTQPCRSQARNSASH